jgi:hypothetical protein
MKFFLPHAKDFVQAEETYQAIKKNVEGDTFPTERKRYYEIFYRHNGQDMHARVGENDPLEREPVIAIFRAKHSGGPFMVCTPNRGVVRGEPILASGDARAIEFEPASKLR